MKKLLFLFTFAAMLFAGCEGGENVKTPKHVLTIATSTSLWFEATGGTGTIGYAVTDSSTGEVIDIPVEVTCEANWITNITVGESITFEVGVNAENTERETVIVISCEEQRAEVKVKQSGIDAVQFTATHTAGTYYGKLQSRGFNYFLILSDKQPTSINSVTYGATEYRFDIYAEQTSAFNKTHRIPVGVYTVDQSRSGEPGTIDGDRNCSSHFDANMNQLGYISGTLEVTEDSIVANLNMYDGTVHRVEYHGDPVMGDYAAETAADWTPYSALTRDTEFDVSGGYISAYYRGDYYGRDCDVWFLHMIEQKSGFSGVYLMLDLLVPKSIGGWDNKEGFVGEYSILDPASGEYEYHFPAGSMRDDTTQLHVWYMNCVSGQIDVSRSAPIVEGTIKIEPGTIGYVITLDGKDDAGNHISGTFAGTIGDYDFQAWD